MTDLSPSSPPFVMFGGSRRLGRDYMPVVSRVVRSALARGWSVSAGCAAGADAMAIAAVVGSGEACRLSVFCAGDQDGSGLWSGSAPLALLRSAAAAGARMAWLAGGPVHLPLKARLSRRSSAALRAADLAVFFLASPASRGSLAVAAEAATAAMDVFAFSFGFSGPPALLAGCAGFWSPACLAGLSCWRWSPAQLNLF